jgi:hypothetical protein
MNDIDLLTAFENCSLPPAEFHHADHVHVAFLYLCRFSPIEATRRFSEGLKNFAIHNGKPDRYHETITWAFLFLIRERLARSARPEQTWEEFAVENADLLDWKTNVLRKYYSEATLASDLARSVFLLPDGALGKASPLLEP